MRNLVPPEVAPALASPDELDHSRAFLAEAVRFIEGNPLGFSALYARKLYQFWWFGPFSGRTYPAWQLTLYKPLYGLLLCLALFGFAILARSRHRAEAYLLLSIPVAVSVFQSLFYVQGRHRWMVEPFLVMFASVALAWVGTKMMTRGRRETGPTDVVGDSVAAHY